MPKPRAIVEALAGYVKQHPDEILRVIKNAPALRFGLPLQAFRWLAGQGNPGKAPREVELVARPPGIQLSASFDLMATPLRASAVIYVQKVDINAEQLRFELRLAEVSLHVTDESADTALAALLKSGALDLSQPGNLAAYMPKRPAVLVDAKGDSVVVDLMKHPKLSTDPRVGKLLTLLTPLFVLDRVETQDEHLDLQFSAFPEGVVEAWDALRHRF